MNKGSLFQAVLGNSARNSKPRSFGLTIALDVGLGSHGAADLVETAAAHCDYVKIAWGSSLITSNVEAKLDIYRKGGIQPLLGGTLFEYAWLHGKLEERTKKLHERLKAAQTQQEDKLCEELVRNWLYTKRPLLKSTLDHLGVKNDNGLVEEEPTFFKELTVEKVTELVNLLKKEGHPDEHIRIVVDTQAV